MTAEPTLVLAGRPVLEFQPAVDLATGRLLGFEALVRWDHPTKGHIPPEVLLPWAEANDDIVSLNSWVIGEACAQAQRWPSGIQVAVNCSIVQLRNGEASTAVTGALEESGLNPDRLTIEVTERAIADDNAAQDLRAVSALGVHLAVDDVGTSWSTLEPLRRFEVETVKIDQAFITSLEAREGMNRAIVEAVIHVSHSLAMSTVAEGVESAQQVAILREFGADVAQGYFFDRPLPDEEAFKLANVEPRAVYPLNRATGPVRTGAVPLTVITGDVGRRVDATSASGVAEVADISRAARNHPSAALGLAQASPGASLGPDGTDSPEPDTVTGLGAQVGTDPGKDAGASPDPTPDAGEDPEPVTPPAAKERTAAKSTKPNSSQANSSQANSSQANSSQANSSQANSSQANSGQPNSGQRGQKQKPSQRRRSSNQRSGKGQGGSARRTRSATPKRGPGNAAEAG